MNKTSGKQLQYAKKSDRKNYDSFHMRFPKGKLKIYQNLAKSRNVSLTALINEVLEKEIK